MDRLDSEYRALVMARQRKQRRFEKIEQIRSEFQDSVRAEYLHPRNTRTLRDLAKETGLTFGRIGQIVRGE